MKKIVKKLAAISLTIISVFSLAGCRESDKEAIDELENNVRHVLVDDNLVDFKSCEISDYQLSSIKIKEYDDRKCVLDLDGFVNYEDYKQVSMISMLYDLKSEDLDCVNLNNKFDVIKFSSSVVLNNKPYNIEKHDLDNLKEINETFRKYAKGKKDSETLKYCRVYNIGVVECQENSVSFNMSAYNSFEETYRFMTMAMAGKVPVPIWHTSVRNNDYDQEVEIKINLTPEEVELVRMNSSEAIKMFINKVKQNDNENLFVEIVNIVKINETTVDNTKNLDL